MHVYKINDCDFVASKLDKEKTNTWYSVETGEENEIEEVEDLDLDKNGIFYTVSAKEAINKRFKCPYDPPNIEKCINDFKESVKKQKGQTKLDKKLTI